MLKSPSQNAETPVRALHEKESCLNSILVLRDCIGERLTLEVVLRYGSCRLVNIPSCDCKVSLLCDVFLRKNESFSKFGH